MQICDFWSMLVAGRRTCQLCRSRKGCVWQFFPLRRNLCRVSNERGDIMILGMSTATFVLVHVVISLIGIVAGLVVMFGMLGSKRQPGLTAIFLLTTILTSA